MGEGEEGHLLLLLLMVLLLAVERVGAVLSVLWGEGEEEEDQGSEGTPEVGHTSIW